MLYQVTQQQYAHIGQPALSISQIQDTQTQALKFLQTQFSSSAGAWCRYSEIRTPWLWLTLRTNREELETFHVGSEI